MSTEKKIDRRGFFKKASAVGAVAAVYSNEERNLLAYQQQQGAPGRGPGGPGPGAPDPGRARMQEPRLTAAPMPMGKLGNAKVSRLIAGHDLVAFIAHSRDLMYVSQLLQAYFTDDKILETWRKSEAAGINTSFLRVEAHMLDLAKKHKASGGKMQWLAQVVVNEQDQSKDIEAAMELNPIGGYVRGLESDKFRKAKGGADVILKSLENMKKYKIPVGLAAHELNSLIWAEKQGFPTDFYVKTFNSAKYWSAPPPIPPDPAWKPTETDVAQPEFGGATHDNIWETTPKATAEFFAKLKKPFLAYKVLAAGAISPSDGFKYAFDNGADFIVVGMYDFQINQNVNITKDAVAKVDRKRAWIAETV